MKFCRQMLTLSTKLKNGSFPVAERSRTVVKCIQMKNALGKGVKLLFFVIQTCKFVTFLSPPSSITLPLSFKDHQAHRTKHKSTN